MLCEGAAAEWSAVYLRDNKHTTLAFAGLGFTVYSLAMVSVRLSGNRLLRWRRPEQLLPVLAGVATVGLGLGLVSNETAVLLAGFGCLGFGLALVVPTVFSAAGRVPGVHPGTAIAVVSAFGWTGFVCGPPIIGQIASVWSLRIALGLLPLLTGLIALATARSGAMRSRVPRVGAPRGGCARCDELMKLSTPASSCAPVWQWDIRFGISAGGAGGNRAADARVGHAEVQAPRAVEEHQCLGEADVAHLAVARPDLIGPEEGLGVPGDTRGRISGVEEDLSGLVRERGQGGIAASVVVGTVVEQQDPAARSAAPVDRAPPTRSRSGPGEGRAAVAAPVCPGTTWMFHCARSDPAS